MTLFRRRQRAPASTGAAAEQFARCYLKQQGLGIEAVNFRTRRGEIDIIARDPTQNTLVFVEVRLRSNPGFGSASASIDRNKQQRLALAAQQYLQEKRLVDNCSCRFDALCLSPQPGKSSYAVEWLRDAFWPEC